MNQAIVFELDHHRKRLAYYQNQKAQLEARLSSATETVKAPKSSTLKKSAAPTETLDKWIEVYAERVKKLEKQASKAGLRVELNGSAKAAPQSRLN